MEVIAKPHNLASTLALAIYSKVLDAVRADHLVTLAVQRIGDSLFIQGHHIDLNHFDRVWIAGSGKASVPMARSLADILGDRLAGGLVITKSGSAEPIESLTVLEAAHPIPDACSLAAGDQMLKFAESMNEKDLVLYVLSGGSSALLESLLGDLTLEDLQLTNQALLASGFDIKVINKVRSKLSRIKGGRLGAAFFPATVINLVLSDVVGNDLAVVGSGPLIANPRTSFPIWELPLSQFPKAVQTALISPADSLEQTEPIPHYVIGSISLAIHAAVDASNNLGLLTLPFGDPMLGEARDMARRIIKHSSDHPRESSCMIFGGETTVRMRGTGLGGRCQEMAVAGASPVSKQENVCFLAAGTDGYDGPTDALGGFVDPESLERARKAGFNPRTSLSENDSYHFLQACEGLILTGPTGSNVNDIALFVRA